MELRSLSKRLKNYGSQTHANAGAKATVTKLRPTSDQHFAPFAHMRATLGYFGYLRVRTLHRVIRSLGGSSGRTAPSAAPESGWWRGAKAQTEPAFGSGGEKAEEKRTSGGREPKSQRLGPYLRMEQESLTSQG